MNRKGEGSLWAIDAIPSYMIFVFFVGIITIGFVFFAQQYAAEQYQFPEGLKNFVVSERFTKCFGDSKTIDYNLFTKQRLNDCYRVDKQSKVLAYRLTLSIKESKLTIETENWNGYFDSSKIDNVRILKDGNFLEGTLKIEVQE